MRRDGRRGGIWVDLGLVGLTLVWFVGTPRLFFHAVAEGLRGARLHGFDEASAHGYLVAAAVVLVAAPASAALVAGLGRRKFAAWAYGLSAAVCLALVMAVLALGQRGRADDAAPRFTPPPGHCVEHSGGDNRCPGG
ncbi:DUF6234 family protein [Bailinhaonella thermotolerans]|uniref:DUF6234 domain-containing protein n=1 Tax=Bailinhaonella thermotolerans TaxID=1070861 RepID=A0A3A4AT72_9ACTN|nr:DUF6234 family protein [Bailinhaonella thermotolerans]RJL22762.1 hypothetical protein D5H75_34805 [Bailinhaonella thermotolerans]